LSKRQYNGGQWTKARFESFIRNGLRTLSVKWPPRQAAKVAARVERGVYMCKGFNKRAHKVRARDIQLDHIVPVIEIGVGHTTWDKYINRLFCEEERFQVLCKECHKRKTKNERVSKSAL